MAATTALVAAALSAPNAAGVADSTHRTAPSSNRFQTQSFDIRYPCISRLTIIAFNLLLHYAFAALSPKSI
ncbi:hypothetical protein B0H13DRAFT_2660265 [Mycena leptocephala]|nr:hypothetical protein B0H13DRAFT_2660265 [Mycena leptocephala]